MTDALQEAEELLARMTRADKARLLQSVARDLGDAFPGIESTPGVAGGEPCIVRTRIPVWLLEQTRRLGTSEADLLQVYPTLRAEDLVNAWAYVRSHRDEIDDQIRENEVDAIFDLGDSGGSDIAAHKDAYLVEAVAAGTRGRGPGQ